MSIVKKLVGLGATFALTSAVLIGIAWHIVSQPSVPPSLPAEYWGPGKAITDRQSIVPFTINVSADILDDLHDRLELVSSLTDPLEDANFRYGFNTEYLKKVVNFWLNNYKWREQEAFLNSLPQYKTQVAGLNLHFIHAKPSKIPAGVKVLPLLLLHGWPGSVREFYELIPLLITPYPNREFVFEVVVPSLPGYGFSQGASKQGLGAAQMAVIMKSLMDRLNFKQFYLQGGDWGAIIGTHMSVLFPNSVLGYHSNMCAVATPLSTIKRIISGVWPSLFMEAEEIAKFKSLGEAFPYLLEETGYMHLQATKPDTIGVALRDSPVGLAAYILEKFSTWTDPAWRSLPDGGLTKKYTLTSLLDNIMIYWVTGSITTSVRLYSETFNKAQFLLDLDRATSSVPTACAVFPHELDTQTKFILNDKFINLVQVTYMPRGGHFAAFEEPQLVFEDIVKAVDKIRNNSNNAD